MPGDTLEKRIIKLLAIKEKHNLDNEEFLLLIGQVNLMSIVNLLEMRATGGVQGSRTGSPQDIVPFLNMFGGAKGRVPTDGAQK